MWVDFYSCDVCGDWFPDCWDYCWTKEWLLICDRCMEEYNITKDKINEDGELDEKYYKIKKVTKQTLVLNK